MESEAWVFAAFALMALVHLGLVLYWRRRSAGTSGEVRPNRVSDGTPTRPVEDDDRLVVCSDCGEHNEPGYHYCRRCISELGSDRRTAPPGSNSRGVF